MSRPSKKSIRRRRLLPPDYSFSSSPAALQKPLTIKGLEPFAAPDEETIFHSFNDTILKKILYYNSIIKQRSEKI